MHSLKNKVLNMSFSTDPNHHSNSEFSCVVDDWNSVMWQPQEAEDLLYFKEKIQECKKASVGSQEGEEH